MKSITNWNSVIAKLFFFKQRSVLYLTSFEKKYILKNCGICLIRGPNDTWGWQNYLFCWKVLAMWSNLWKIEVDYSDQLPKYSVVERGGRFLLRLWATIQITWVLLVWSCFWFDLIIYFLELQMVEETNLHGTFYKILRFLIIFLKA